MAGATLPPVSRGLLGHIASWQNRTGTNVHSFGASAPGDVMMEKFGFTPEKVVEAAKKL
jgi:transketolase